MRKFIATFLALFFVMASLPLQSIHAKNSGVGHSGITSVAATADEATADCCEMPMHSMHHSGVHCSMDCPAIPVWSSVLYVGNVAQFSVSSDANRISQTASARFRPPIFA